jgi:hypothetical protein
MKLIVYIYLCMKVFICRKLRQGVLCLRLADATWWVPGHSERPCTLKPKPKTKQPPYPKPNHTKKNHHHNNQIEKKKPKGMFLHVYEIHLLFFFRRQCSDLTATTAYAPFSKAHETLYRTDHMPGHKTNLSKLKGVERTWSVLFG